MIRPQFDLRRIKQVEMRSKDNKWKRGKERVDKARRHELILKRYKELCHYNSTTTTALYISKWGDALEYISLLLPSLFPLWITTPFSPLPPPRFLSPKFLSFFYYLLYFFILFIYSFLLFWLSIHMWLKRAARCHRKKYIFCTHLSLFLRPSLPFFILFI